MLPMTAVGLRFGHSATSAQCPFWPTLRTQVGHLPRSEKCQEGHMQCSKDRASFNQCVSTHQKRFRDRKANGLGSSKIDGQLELRGLLYGQIVRLPAL